MALWSSEVNKCLGNSLMEHKNRDKSTCAIRQQCTLKLFSWSVSNLWTTEIENQLSVDPLDQSLVQCRLPILASHFHLRLPRWLPELARQYWQHRRSASPNYSPQPTTLYTGWPRCTPMDRELRWNIFFYPPRWIVTDRTDQAQAWEADLAIVQLILSSYFEADTRSRPGPLFSLMQITGETLTMVG